MRRKLDCIEENHFWTMDRKGNGKSKRAVSKSGKMEGRATSKPVDDHVNSKAKAVKSEELTAKAFANGVRSDQSRPFPVVATPTPSQPVVNRPTGTPSNRTTSERKGSFDDQSRRDPGGSEKEEEFTPEQQRILAEKAELERLLEMTKQLQHQADMYLSGSDKTLKDSKTSREKLKQRTTGVPEASGKDSRGNLAKTNPDQSTVALGFPPTTDKAEKIALSPTSPSQTELEITDGKSDSRPEIDTESRQITELEGTFDSISAASGISWTDQFSLQDNIDLLEENAGLLEKKIELEILLQKAKILLEKTDLPETVTQHLNEDRSREEIDSDLTTVVDSPSENVSLAKRTRPEPELEAGEEEPDEKKLKLLFEKADELSYKAKVLLGVLHENKAPVSGDGQQHGDSELPSPKSTNQAEKNELPPTETFEDTLSHPGNLKVATKSGGNTETSTERVGDNEDDDEKFELRKLMERANALLEISNRPRWSETEGNALAKDIGAEISTDGDGNLSLIKETATSKEESATSKQETATPCKDGAPFNDTESQIETSTLKAVAEGKTLCQGEDALSSFQSTLQCETHELEFLLAQTHLLQKKADDIFNKKQSSEGVDNLDPSKVNNLENLGRKEVIPDSQNTGLEELPTSDTAENQTGDDDDEDNDDDDDDDDDDSSLDANVQLQLLLQRARVVLEKSKIPVSERLHLEYDETEEQHQSSANSNLSLFSKGSSNGAEVRTEGTSDSKKQKVDRLDEVESGSFEKLTQDAQLELLLQQTKILRDKANSLISEMEPQPDETVIHEEGEESTADLKRKSEDGEASTSRTADTLDQLHDNTQQEVNTDGRTKQDDENQLEVANVLADTNLSAQETKAQADDLEASQNKDSLLEFEEVEESQLEVQEIEKSEIEDDDEYLSDNSEMSDMVMYYEGPELTDDDDEEYFVNIRQITESKVEPNTESQTHVPYKSESAAGVDSKSQQERLASENGVNNLDEPVSGHVTPVPAPIRPLTGLTEQQLVAGSSSVPDVVGEPLLQEDTGLDGSQESSMSVVEQDISEREQLQILLERTKQLLEMTRAPLAETELQTLSEKANISEMETRWSVGKAETYHDSTKRDDSVVKPDNSKDVAETNAIAVNGEDAESKSSQSLHPPDELQHLRDEHSQDDVQDVGSTNSFEQEAELLREPNNELSTAINQLSTTTTVLTKEMSDKLHQLQEEVAVLMQSKPDTESRLPRSSSENQANQSSSNVTEPLEVPDTMCSGHLKQNTKEGEDADHHPSDPSEAESGDTGTGVPKTDAPTHVKEGTFKSWNSLTNHTRLLRLQKEMAKMQLHMSNLQEAMRVSNSILQELIDDAFTET